MQASVSQRPGQGQVKHARHAGSFAKVLDGRKQPMRGLCVRNGRCYERGMEIKQVKAVQVQTIVSLRVEEKLKIMAEELEPLGLMYLLRAGVLFCGGGARMTNITTLAEIVFQMKCEVGHANGVSGLSKTLDEPEFATAIGLVKYGAMQQRQSSANLPWWLRLWVWLKNLTGFGG